MPLRRAALSAERRPSGSARESGHARGRDHRVSAVTTAIATGGASASATTTTTGADQASDMIATTTVIATTATTTIVAIAAMTTGAMAIAIGMTTAARRAAHAHRIAAHAPLAAHAHRIASARPTESRPLTRTLLLPPLLALRVRLAVEPLQA